MRSARNVSLSLVFLLLASSLASADAVPWQRSVEDAKRLAAQTNRLVLLHFYTDSCMPCKILEKNVFSQPVVGAQIAANYVPVKVNARDYPAVSQRYNITTVPADVVITPTGQVVRQLKCPQKAAQYLAGLGQVAVAARSQAAGAYANVGTHRPRPAVTAPSPAQGAGYATQPRQPAQSAAVGGRYANHFSQQNSPAAQPNLALPDPAQGAPQPNRAAAPSPPADTRYAQPRYQAPQSQAPRYQAHVNPPAVNPRYQPQPNRPSNRYTAPAPRQPQPAPKTPRFGLAGMCPVTLATREQWVRGDRRWGAVHQGVTYLFAGQAEQQQFLANPNKFSPVFGGVDPVIALDQHQKTSGQVHHGLFFEGRVFLFSSEVTLAQFSRSPYRYLQGVRQAEAAGRPPRG